MRVGSTFVLADVTGQSRAVDNRTQIARAWVSSELFLELHFWPPKDIPRSFVPVC